MFRTNKSLLLEAIKNNDVENVAERIKKFRRFNYIVLEFDCFKAEFFKDMKFETFKAFFIYSANQLHERNEWTDRSRAWMWRIAAGLFSARKMEYLACTIEHFQPLFKEWGFGFAQMAAQSGQIGIIDVLAREGVSLRMNNDELLCLAASNKQGEMCMHLITRYGADAHAALKILQGEPAALLQGLVQEKLLSESPSFDSHARQIAELRQMVNDLTARLDELTSPTVVSVKPRMTDQHPLSK